MLDFDQIYADASPDQPMEEPTPNPDIQQISATLAKMQEDTRKNTEAVIRQVELMQQQLDLAKSEAETAHQEADDAIRASRSANRIAIAAIVISALISLAGIILPQLLH